MTGKLEETLACENYVVLDRSDVMTPISRNHGLRKLYTDRFSARLQALEESQRALSGCYVSWRTCSRFLICGSRSVMKLNDARQEVPVQEKANRRLAKRRVAVENLHTPLACVPIRDRERERQGSLGLRD